MSIKYLPYSARRYSINQDGLLFDMDGTELKFENNEVELEWVLGKRKYDRLFIMVVTFRNVQLPLHLWDKIQPLIEPDVEIKAKNIFYKYKSLLEVEDHPGFYYIPNFNNYAISIDGAVINLQTQKNKVWSKTKPNKKRGSTGGYKYTRCISDLGDTKICFEHRLKCSVFKNYSTPIENKVINHKDGSPSNNKLENIEITTYSANNTHALRTGLRKKVKPVTVLNLKTGEELTFYSAAACGAELGYSSGDPITNAISKSRILLNEYIFKYSEDDWLDSKKYTQLTLDDFIAKNVFTGEQILFSGTHQAKHLIGLYNNQVTYQADNKSVIPSNGWLVRYLSDIRHGLNWPKYTEEHLEIIKNNDPRGCKGLVVIDIKTNERFFFSKLTDAIDHLKITRTELLEFIKSGEMTFNETFNLKLIDVKEDIRSAMQETV